MCSRLCKALAFATLLVPPPPIHYLERMSTIFIDSASKPNTQSFQSSCEWHAPHSTATDSVDRLQNVLPLSSFSFSKTLPHPPPRPISIIIASLPSLPSTGTAVAHLPAYLPKQTDHNCSSLLPHPCSPQPPPGCQLPADTWQPPPASLPSPSWLGCSIPPSPLQLLLPSVQRGTQGKGVRSDLRMNPHR